MLFWFPRRESAVLRRVRVRVHVVDAMLAATRQDQFNCDAGGVGLGGQCVDATLPGFIPPCSREGNVVDGSASWAASHTQAGLRPRSLTGVYRIFDLVQRLTQR